MKFNYFKPTKKKAKKFILAMQGLFGSSAMIAFMNNKPEWSTYILIAGAAIDFIVRMISDGSEENNLPQ